MSAIDSRGLNNRQACGPGRLPHYQGRYNVTGDRADSLRHLARHEFTAVAPGSLPAKWIDNAALASSDQHKFELVAEWERHEVPANSGLAWQADSDCRD